MANFSNFLLENTKEIGLSQDKPSKNLIKSRFSNEFKLKNLQRKASSQNCFFYPSVIDISGHSGDSHTDQTVKMVHFYSKII